MKIKKAEKAIGYVFKNKRLLCRAFTLASADCDENNQMLEFFGDAILEFIASEELYTRNPNADEGELTKRRAALVKDDALARVSEKLGLDDLLIRGAGDNNNRKAVPSVYEAVIAALYLDGGIEAAKKFVLFTLNFDVVFKEEPKSRLNEYLQGKKQPTPDYDGVTENCGTPQRPEFKTVISVFGVEYTGTGVNKKEAQSAAALAALRGLNVKI